MRRGAGVVAAAYLLVVTATPALADRGVSVGPARQLVEAHESFAEVLVSNPTDQPTRVQASSWRYTAEGWVEDGRLPMFPERFKLAPHGERTVRVFVGERSRAPCALVGAGFAIEVERADGITAQGLVLAQLALQGAEGTEADCRAILPEAPPSPAPSRPFPWQVVVVVAAGVGLYAVGRRRHRPAFVWIERR